MPGACSLFRYSVEKLSATLSDNLAMSTDVTFISIKTFDFIITDECHRR